MPANAFAQGEPDYQALATFRHLIRRFLVFSEQAARSAGLKPQQHQLLLAVKGLSPYGLPTVGELAWQLQLKHHTLVELVDRMEKLGLIRRNRHEIDHREVLIEVTSKGESMLRKLSLIHHEELRRVAPQILPAMAELFSEPSGRSSLKDKELPPRKTPLQRARPRTEKRPRPPRVSATSRSPSGSSRSVSSRPLRRDAR